LRRGEFRQAECHFRTAIARLTARNPNPYDSEPHYNLGMALLFQDRIDEAYDAFFKATWSAAWRGPGYHRLAEIDMRKGRLAAAIDYLDRSLRADADNTNARNLRAAVLRQLRRPAEAEAELETVLALDPLDAWSYFQRTGVAPTDAGKRLDVVFDCIRAGLLDDAEQVLARGTGVMELYARALIAQLRGDGDASAALCAQAEVADSTYVFPSRLEEMKMLEAAI